ncbi:MAG TPA: YciI family protein [Chitinophagaceae bacterium]|nr:YciI family protein [Chitinophagaceae bacterium]
MITKILLATVILLGGFGAKHGNNKPQTSSQFVYVLTYTAEFKQAIRWGPKESGVVREHVAYVKDLVDEGKGYVLGRTSNVYDPELFGIVVFEAKDIEAAKRIMNDDPVIKNNIMKGVVHPFTIVFLKEKSQ